MIHKWNGNISSSVDFSAVEVGGSHGFIPWHEIVVLQSLAFTMLY